MKLEPSFGFIRLSRGISTSEDFVELNRKLLAKLLTKSFQVFTSYKHISSCSAEEETTYFVIDQTTTGDLGSDLQKLRLEFAPDLSISDAYGHLAPDSVMGKWAMSLISKS